jgi:hypothetical protein
MNQARLILLFLIIFFWCNLEIKGQEAHKATPLKIDFEAVVKKDISLNLSEIIDYIEYIPLETGKIA